MDVIVRKNAYDLARHIATLNPPAKQRRGRESGEPREMTQGCSRAYK